jgi:hypothetical protein
VSFGLFEVFLKTRGKFFVTRRSTARRIAKIHGVAYDGTSTGRHSFTMHLPDGRAPSFTIDQYERDRVFIYSQHSEKALPISAKSVQRGELIMNSYQSAPQPGARADFFWSDTIVCFEERGAIRGFSGR